jgi:hypothetical protein
MPPQGFEKQLEREERFDLQRSQVMRRIVSVLVASVLVLTALFIYYEPGEGCTGGCITPCNGCFLTATAEAGGAQDPSGNARAAAAGADALMQESTPTTFGTPPFTGFGDCLLGYDFPELVTLLGMAKLDPDQNRPLCLIDIQLPPGRTSNSYVLSGETDTFYVCAGDITFEVSDYQNWDPDKGFVRVVPGPSDSEDELLDAGLTDQGDGSFRADMGVSYTLSTGSSIYLDEQPDDVFLMYTNSGGGEENAELLISSAPPPGVVGDEATPMATPEAKSFC